MSDDDELGEYTVRSSADPLSDGYYAAIDFDQDTTILLDAETTPSVANAMIQVVTYAEYDVAVLKQLRSQVSDENTAIQAVVDLRGMRPKPDLSALAPYSFTPGVNQETKPFVTVYKNEEAVAQIDLDALRGMAIDLMDAVHAAQLDQIYHTYLTETIGVSSDAATGVIGTLLEFRELR